MATMKHEFEFQMSCEGCSGAAKRVISKLGDSIQNFEADIPKQRVYVTTSLSADEVKAQLEKTGKEAKFIASHNC